MPSGLPTIRLTNAPRLPYDTYVAKKNTAVRIKERDLVELESLAKKEDETVSSLIRRAIREFLEKQRGKTGGAS